MASGKKLTVYYKSGWTDPVLHFGFEGHDWSDAQFARVLGEPEWWWTSMPLKAASMQCVPRAQDSSGWDNPPGGGNYKIDLPLDDYVVAVLRAGDVSIVNLSRQPWALVADMDGTLIENGHPEMVERLRTFWDMNCRFAIRPSDGVRLCQMVYNSGRNREDMLKGCRENDLPRPDYMICGVGTEIYVPAKPDTNGTSCTPWFDQAQLPETENDWRQLMDKEFGDRAALAAEVAAQFPSLDVRGNVDSDPYRLPCMADIGANPTLVDGLQAWVEKEKKGLLRVIMSGMGDHRFVDICSVHADKGLAIDYIFKKGGFPGLTDKSRIIVAGDSGNDLRMFMVPGVRSVMVANSQPSLVEAVLEAGSIDLSQTSDIQSSLPYRVQRPEPLLEVYYSKGHIGDGVCEAIQAYYFDC